VGSPVSMAKRGLDEGEIPEDGEVAEQGEADESVAKRPRGDEDGPAAGDEDGPAADDEIIRHRRPPLACR